MIKEQTVVFVWRCPDCPRVYDGEGLPFLYTDEDYGYCPCGGRLVEDVASEEERRCRPVISERLKGTSLHRQLERLLASEEGVEVALGPQEVHRIDLFGYL
jgi:hypothetical protein